MKGFPRRGCIIPSASPGVGAPHGRDCSLRGRPSRPWGAPKGPVRGTRCRGGRDRSEEHTSELQSLMRTSYAVFCLKKKTHHSLKRNIHPLNNNNTHPPLMPSNYATSHT